MKKRITTILCLMAAIAALTGISCSKQEFSNNYDIPWPVPQITGLSSVKDTIGKTITIRGSEFQKLSSVSIGNPTVTGTIVSSSDTAILFQLPRVFKAGPVTVSTLYKKTVTDTTVFTPIYLDLTVTAFPSVIIRGEPFIIKGQNLDMVTEVDVNGNKIAVSPAAGAPTDQLSIPTQGLTLPDAVTIKVTGALAGINNGNSGSINVEDPSDYFVPVEPKVLFDFENGVDPYQNGDVAATHGINTGALATLGRGQKYFTLKVNNVPSAWGTWLGGITATNIDISDFHKPYLTFLVNTNGHDGYFQLAVTQGGVQAGTDFTSAYTGVATDNYNFKTTGWEWRSVPLEVALSDWGQGSYTVDKSQLIEAIQLSFKQGNGSNPFEINLDQIMITDGPQKPVYTLFDFEDGVNPYSGTASAGINQSGIAPISGNNYLTVQKAGAASWDWTGEITRNGPFSLTSISNAYINFWINTNGKKGFLQMETTQNGTKWGASLNTTDYMIETTGWQLISLRLADIQWSVWGGTGTSLDLKGSLDYFKLGFTTGNVSGNYEVNIDDVIISDGPVF